MHHYNYFVSIDQQKQYSFDCIDKATEFMLETWDRGKHSVCLHQIDPDYQETDQLAPGYPSVLNLIDTKLYQDRMQDISLGFKHRHDPMAKANKNQFKMFMKSHIKQVRPYRDLRGVM